ncbi:hypothetical protein QYM36_017256 [Artemia franciscana]|uniref:Uncharacterized protein n=1 Tax=Artemia franciscana TaxID=6661 RepID=A0AA88KSR5_ARTSF|nr:hypothetical protein QYM36_017256 [Artemia franciscana]
MSGPSNCTPDQKSNRGKRHVLSPGYKTRKSILVAESESFIPDNDDEAELRERHKIRYAEIQQQTLQSPGAPLGRRRTQLGKDLEVANAAVTEHYSNCIKLSAENLGNPKLNLKSVPKMDLEVSNAAVTEHYSNCIKLSAENVSSCLQTGMNIYSLLS